MSGHGASAARPNLPERRLPGRLLIAAAVVLGLLGVGGIVATQVNDDSDGDGIPNRLEESGWRTATGLVYITNPDDPDTDGDGLSDGAEAGPNTSSPDAQPVYAGISDPTSMDSDGDGAGDRAEVLGGMTTSGIVIRTEPMNPDTDGDGLTDGEELGRIFTSNGATTFDLVSDPRTVDSDGDGIDDKAELYGWARGRGSTYRTQPLNSDSDGDGLEDGDEAGLVERRPEGRAVPAAFSNPLVPDTDGDGLSDLGEADLSLDAFKADTDGDGLDDYVETEVLGTAPDVADTDSDGFPDGFEVENAETQGLDPLWPDVKVSPARYARDFAQGLILGELTPGDSLAWLLGNLSSGGSSFVPGIGWALGGVADLRDAVGAAIHADWVGASFIMLGLLPAIGDTAALRTKVAKFIARNPDLAPEVGRAIGAITWIPTDAKVQTSKMLVDDWDYLRAEGLSEDALLRLQQGRSSLKVLAAAMKSARHVDGADARFIETGADGEALLARQVAKDGRANQTQAVRSTRDCPSGANAFVRRFDVLVDQVAHESKVGQVSLTKSIERQIRSDACLVDRGEIDSAHWHFYASAVSDTVGASQEVFDLLDALEIDYSIHAPR